MTQIDGWQVTGNIKSFRRGATAFRNARDLARRHQTQFIQAVNARHVHPDFEQSDESWQDAHDALQGQISDACDNNTVDKLETHAALELSQIDNKSSNYSQASTLMANEDPFLNVATSFASSLGNDRRLNPSVPDNSAHRKTLGDVARLKSEHDV